jgi:ArsR family transcriptional regulator
MQEYVENCIIDEEVKKKIKSYLPHKSDIISMERVFTLFADKTRLRIVLALSITPMIVNDIVEVLGINQTTLSHQLAFLRNLGVVEDRRIGKNVVYSLKNKTALSLLSCALDFIEEDSAKIEDIAIDF